MRRFQWRYSWDEDLWFEPPGWDPEAWRLLVERWPQSCRPRRPALLPRWRPCRWHGR